MNNNKRADTFSFMRKLTPTIRLTLGLAMTVVSLLLLAEVAGIMPDERHATQEARRMVIESLAVQLASIATGPDRRAVRETIEALAERNAEVVSVGLRRADGSLLEQAGNHDQHWVTLGGSKSTINQLQVPLMNGEQQWGAVEIVFASHGSGMFAWLFHSLWGLVFFMAVMMLAIFYLILRRTLRELDPRSAVPQRIRSAFDTLAEGVLILDDKGNIVLANKAFAKRSGRAADSLIGQRPTQMDWKNASDDRRPPVLPWERTLRTGEKQERVSLRLSGESDSRAVFVINSTPIADERNQMRGVMVTLDDVTEMEKRNVELHQTVEKLRASETEIKRANEKLYQLATHDPLTECLNRRALFSSFESSFRKVKEEGLVLSCMMVDIDHFKPVNDTYGHAAGDQALQWVAARIREAVNPTDIVGRYGGEEFCVVMNAGLAGASEIGQRIRTAIESSQCPIEGLRLTVSVGVSSVQLGARDPEELIVQADQALYAAKEGGRNRVIRWNAALGAQAPESENTRQAPRPADKLAGLLSGYEDALLGRAGTGETQSDAVRVHNEFLSHIAQALEKATQERKQVAVVSIFHAHLWRLAEARDTITHDAFMAEIDRRLAKVLRDEDRVLRLKLNEDASVSHLGSDELGALVTGLEEERVLEAVIGRVQRALAAHMEIGGQVMDPDGWWLGAAMSPDAGRAPMELVTNAVTARYAAMADGQVGHARLYRTGLNPAEQRRLLIRREMKAAIEHDQFALHYQPVYDSRQRNYSSWEAFARWSCPGLGEVRPREFIPIAEEAGLAHALGQWVLFTACRQAQKWSTEVSPAPHVAINLSTVQLHYADLVSEVSRALRETGLTPSSLLIEITESAILHDPTNTARTLRDLHALGVGIVLDDLGAGYSTLSNITNLPVDTVKIDRVFLSAVHRDHSAADIYEAIIGKARSLKLNIVAEGVETRADLDFVAQLGCDRVQGYFVSRPLPVEAALSAMRSGPGADGAAKNTATTPDNLIPFRAARARK